MAYYDNYSKRSLTSLRDKLQKRFYRALFNKFKISPKKNADVLEIGPGEGGFAKFLNTYEINYSGVEQSASLTEHLIKEGYKVTEASCPPIPYSDNTFDLIFCFHVIEHLDSPFTVHAFVEECQRILKPDGKLVMIAPDYMRMGKYFWDCDYTHITPITERRLKQILLDSNLKIEKLGPITEPFVGSVRYLINFLLFFYPYSVLEYLFPFEPLRTVIYKIRSTFSQSVLAIAKK